MESQEIKRLISEYQQFVVNVEVLARPIDFEPNDNYVFVGLRRVGKSYLMYQIIQNLLKSGKKKEEILFVNFEDERFLGAQTSDLSKIIDCYNEMYDLRPVIFLDEVQIIPGWQKFVRRLADQKYLVFVSGSNAEMLSGEIATTLGGRFIIHEVYPYSFSEFLVENKIELKKNWEYSEIKNSVVRLFETYLQYGGLPEILGRNNKRPWLSGLYQKIFFGDIITRYEIRNDNALKLLIKKLAESVMHPISYNRLANIVSTTGKKISVSTTIDYLKYLNASWLVFGLANYVAALGERESVKKYYFTDNGILNLFLLDGNTRLLENLVAINLYKKYGEKVYFYNKNIEVDFYLPEAECAIQVSYDISNPDTFDRETSALIKLSKVVAIKHFTIITYDDERSISLGGIDIEIVPLYKWLLTTIHS